MKDIQKILFATCLTALFAVWAPVYSAGKLNCSTTQSAYIRSKIELVDGCRLLYSITNKSSSFGCGHVPKGAIKYIGPLHESADEVTIELIIWPKPDEVKRIIIPAKSIPKSGHILITLQADYTIVVTPFEPKFK